MLIALEINPRYLLIVDGALPSANFSFTWYTDQAGTTLLTEPAGKTYFYDSLGNVVNNGDPGARVLKNVSEGTYYVRATDVVTPNFGCVSTPMQYLYNGHVNVYNGHANG